MKDDYKEFYESEEDNLDSKSDAKVILFLIIVAVIAIHSHSRIQSYCFAIKISIFYDMNG